MRRINQLLALCTTSLLLFACESPQQSSPPLAIPTPPSAAPPSSPSTSAEPETKQALPRSKPPSQQGNESSRPETEKTENSQGQSRQKAAEALMRAGKQVSRNAQRLLERPRSESDPLIPDNTKQSQSEAKTDENSDVTLNSSPQLNDPELTTSNETVGNAYPEDFQEEIRAVQNAMEQASLAIETASTAIETAKTDDDLAGAEKSLANARVSVILAEQDLMEISDIFIDTPKPENIFEAEEALSEANIAIIAATDSVFDASIQLPEFDQPEEESETEPGQAGNRGTGSERAAYPNNKESNSRNELDKELEDSLAIFESRILDARNEAIGRVPAPMPPPSTPSDTELSAKLKDQEDFGGVSGDAGIVADRGESENLEREIILLNPNSGERAKADMQGDLQKPRNLIPFHDEPDTISRQLRELASAERDPALSAKLWAEYFNYKKALEEL